MTRWTQGWACLILAAVHAPYVAAAEVPAAFAYVPKAEQLTEETGSLLTLVEAARLDTGHTNAQ